MSANTDTIVPSFSARFSTPAIVFGSVAKASILSASGARPFTSASPSFSCSSPIAIENRCALPAAVSPIARAVPPTWDSTSFRMMRCAPSTSFVSTIVLMVAFCDSVNWMPIRDSADTPAIGSFSALPSCSAAD